MVDLLLPLDIIEGASVPGVPRLYVLGSYDKRITFYVQQVRALSLVHALQQQGYLRSNPRIAVIGGGAAGITAAAAAALVTNSDVVLFERAQQLLPLQSATARRRLDPHIFDWPEWDTNDPAADLPILDWSAGPAREVRKDVAFDFDGMVTVLAPRLQRRMRHTVTGLARVGASFEVQYERDARLGDRDHRRRVSETDRFDLVFLAIGFGLEPTETLHGLPNQSYWSDAGVPAGEFAGRPHPRFFISGNGDGALIDLAAAGCAVFDHAQMIDAIAGHPGVEDIYEPLRAIDARAREAAGRDERFDFVAAYDAEILPQIQAIGLVPAVRGLLRPGVQLTLQTQHPEMYVTATSTLNRLAAYLTMKACDTDDQAKFSHVHCAEVAMAPAPDPLPYAAQYWLNCNGAIIGADVVIVRRGPERAVARAPFAGLLANFEAAHAAWLKAHGNATLVPRLSPEARVLFESASRQANIPPSRHVQRELAALHVKRSQVRPVAGGLRWSGTVAPADIALAWQDGGARLEIVCPSGPAELGAVASVVIRIATHAQQCTLAADPALWRQFAERLSVASLHAEGMKLPQIEAGQPRAVNRDPTVFAGPALVEALNSALDRWTLRAIDRHIVEYLASGRDPGSRVGFRAAEALRRAMEPIWREWKAAFEADSRLPARFLRLPTCSLGPRSSYRSSEGRRSRS